MNGDGLGQSSLRFIAMFISLGLSRSDRELRSSHSQLVNYSLSIDKVFHRQTDIQQMHESQELSSPRYAMER